VYVCTVERMYIYKGDRMCVYTCDHMYVTQVIDRMCVYAVDHVCLVFTQVIIRMLIR